MVFITGVHSQVPNNGGNAKVDYIKPSVREALDMERIKFFGSIVGILTGVIGLLTYIGTLVSRPALSYEIISYSIEPTRILVVITIRNDGRGTAEEAKVDLKAQGFIENVSVKKGKLRGKIAESELFADRSASVDKAAQSSAIQIREVVGGTKYVIQMIVVTPTYEPVSSLLITSKDGVVSEYTSSRALYLKSVLVGTGFGVVLALSANYRLRRMKRVKT